MSDTDYIKSIEDDNDRLRDKISKLEEELLSYREKEEQRKKQDYLIENAKKWLGTASSYPDKVAKDLANVQPMSNYTIRDILKAYMNEQDKQK
jgi:predicted ribosome quality control (RQC) complex YloA/Tae2 family protein